MLIIRPAKTSDGPFRVGFCWIEILPCWWVRRIVGCLRRKYVMEYEKALKQQSASAEKLILSVDS